MNSAADVTGWLEYFVGHCLANPLGNFTSKIDNISIKVLNSKVPETIFTISGFNACFYAIALRIKGSADSLNVYSSLVICQFSFRIKGVAPKPVAVNRQQ